MSFEDNLKALAKREKQAEVEKAHKREDEVQKKERDKKIAKLVEESTRLLSPFLRDVAKHYLEGDKKSVISSNAVGWGDNMCVEVDLVWDKWWSPGINGYGADKGGEKRVTLIHDRLSNTISVGKITVSLADKKWKALLETAILSFLEGGVRETTLW